MIHTLNCRGALLSLEKPVVMGILNLTPDSFSDGGRYQSISEAINHTGQMLEEGAEIIDIGGYSSRPFAREVSEREELERIYEPTEAIMKAFPEAIISIDTFRSAVARRMLDMGVHIINDISSGNFDDEMMKVVSSYGDVPYIMMHMKGKPKDMQLSPSYDHVFEEVWTFLLQKIERARKAGIRDIVVDPGFGFGKTILHNYQLLGKLDRFTLLRVPVLIGVSRKSMLYKFFDTNPNDVIDMCSVLHNKALEAGVQILRVHDVKEARRVVRLYNYMRENGIV